MDIYRLLRINNRIKNHRVKFLALYFLHIFKRRYLAINLDPVLACNLRCKMCYFTDKDYVKKLKGIFKNGDLDKVANRIFKRALKLQIGCGTEPTLYKDLPYLVSLGKKFNIPYISLTTNANLLNDQKIEELLSAGLNEFTISLHGVTKSSYEDFMEKGNYDTFVKVFNSFAKFKKKYDFKVRINYTFNQNNFFELTDLFKYFNGESFDILQIRPIKSMGNTTYQNLDLTPIENTYPKVLSEIKSLCIKNKISLLAPETVSKSNNELYSTSGLIYNYTFCYISPKHFWRDDFDWENESFEKYTKRINWSKNLLSNVFKKADQINADRKSLNYDIDIN